MTKVGITENLIEKIKDSEEITHLRLGSWLEGIKVGLRSKPPLVPEIKSSEFFVDKLSEEKTKPEVIEKLKPLNPYGASKNEFDKWVLQQSTTPPFWTGFKFFNVYGNNELHKKKTNECCVLSIS